MVVIASVAIATGCSKNDGRTLRDPEPGQTDTVTPATTTSEGQPTVDQLMTVTGPWAEGEALDARYGCDRLNVSPPLAWSGAPAGTVTYAVVLTDIDATEYAHWVVANIAANQASLPEGYRDPLAVVATNSRGKASYTGPCPPKGTTHTYDVTVYALSQTLEAQNGDPAPGLIAAIEAAALASASTSFAFTR